MGLSYSALGARRGYGSFFVSRSSEDLLLKWNATLDRALLEKQGSDALCIKTASARNNSSGKLAEEENETSVSDGAGVFSSFEDDVGSREEVRRERMAVSADQSPGDNDQTLKLRQEIEILKKENNRLNRALCDMEAQSDTLVTECSSALKENNAELRTALQLVSELSGVVKYLKKDAQKQADLIAELKVDKSILNSRLEAALDEIYQQTGNPTFTMRERLLITPRHPYGSITFTSAQQQKTL